MFQHKANITDINSVWLFALGEILPNINCEAANHFETSALLTTYKKKKKKNMVGKNLHIKIY